ncbi:hypothetical protein [Siphonobacter sp. SORGH_AS_0500]|uniref:hypothetical protein n=1 Tax=Siphonobacter sp. SORGH_AS_0500 TaxID=1864824 RepID=UPI000CACCAC3|nr:hypothetical protein [Siphonobacter sp. SORGH_AS_0500]MDR6194446.1 hypothetical protein [Siphonobacter sp. SORGH_AS_0500]PKK37740.1 hypothetical protein BWI96_04540 [Siphonobacter sp. SORGH_AS_0500]
MKTIICLFLNTIAWSGFAQDLVADTVRQTLKARVVEEYVSVDNAATATVTERRVRLVNKTSPKVETRGNVINKNERIPDSLRILKPNPKAQSRPVDTFMRYKQDWTDQITMQVDELNQEIQMLQNAGSNRSGRLQQLTQLRTKSLEVQAVLEKANTELQLQKAIEKAKPVISQGRRFLSAG